MQLDINLDLSKVPGLTAVVVEANSVRLDFVRPGLPFILPGMIQLAAKLDAMEIYVEQIPAAQRKKTSVQFDIEKVESAIAAYKNIYIPVQRAFDAQRLLDTDVTYLSCEERRANKAVGNGQVVRGDSQSITALRLMPGDRFIDNFTCIKYVYQAFHCSSEFHGEPRTEHRVYNLENGKIEVIEDHPSFQYLIGQGPVLPDPKDIVRILNECDLNKVNYYEFVFNSVKRYMKHNHIMQAHEKDIQAIIDIIKKA